MPFSFMKYPLSAGYIHHWLVAGPLEIPDASATKPQQADPLLKLSDAPGIDGSPVDPGLIGETIPANPQPVWRYMRCREDHFVDFTTGAIPPGCRAGYGTVILASPSAQKVNLSLTYIGQAELWLNQQSRLKEGNRSQSDLQTTSVAVDLHPGNNPLVVRLLFSAAHGAMHVVALHVQGPEISGIEAVIPTHIEAEYLEKRMTLEEVVEAAYLDRYMYGYMDGDHYNRNQPVHLRFADQAPFSGEITLRLQSLSGDIFQEGTKLVGPSAELEMARTYPLRSGPHHLALLPPADLYYEKKLRFERKMLFYVARSPFAQAAAPSPWKARVKSVLKDASERRGDSLFSEIAKMALNLWGNIDLKILRDAVTRMTNDAHGSLEDHLGLLGMLLRFGRKRPFPKELKPILLDAAAGCFYRREETASNGLDPGAENRQILVYACEILAGQLLPGRVFKASEKTGLEQRKHAEQLAVDWMRARGKFGFQAWNSPAAIQSVVLALTHLVDLAESELVSELAMVLLDKIFLNMAINSYQGAYACSHGASTTAEVLSARLEATSGMARLLWDLGTFNDAVMGTVSLASCQNYELPDLIARIALGSSAASWSRAQDCLPFTNESSSPAPAWRVNHVSHRTADYMLSSAQDYYPGQKGRGEHIWQAVLGPDALVFTNHPTNMSEEDSHIPNLWRGNGVLPRVAQWGDVLVAIYRLPDDDWMGFTHAYFPTAAFDQTNFAEGWAFARQSSGYLALSAFRGFHLITTGQTAYRELRSHGAQNTWLCHMGHELLDGSFEHFCHKIIQMDLRLSNQSVEMVSLRGDRLAFAWQDHLTVNGTPQPLDGYPHIENRYASAPLPAEEIDILDGRSGIRLKFD